MIEANASNELTNTKKSEMQNSRIAAFFDLDGTLLPLPSLERRFFRMLRYRREIPLKNYFLWLAEALRLLPRGFCAIAQANKMYLRGVKSVDESEAEDSHPSAAHKSGQQAGGQVSATPPKGERRNPRWPVPHFFDEAVDRVEWHAKQGHTIVILSGTLEPLAKIAVQTLGAELAARGLATKVLVCATRLQEAHGRWTGKIVGFAMFGEAKARAATQLAEEMLLDLANSFAYGDSANDRRLLDTVGNPSVVNPSRRLLRFARRRNLPVLHWGKERCLTQIRGGHGETDIRKRKKAVEESLLFESSRIFQKPLCNAEPCP